MSIPSALHGFWFSVCVSYLFLQHFTGSDSLFVFYVYSFSSSRILIFCLCFISIPSALHGFWFSVCVLFLFLQHFTGSDSLAVFYIDHISLSRVLTLWLCFILIPSVLHGFWLWLCFILITSVLHGFWLSGCVLYWSHQSFTGSDSLVRFYIHHISPFRILTLCLWFIYNPSSLSGSDYLFVFTIYSISTSRVLILCLCFVSIPSTLHGFWFSVCDLYIYAISTFRFWLSVCVLYLFHQHFTGSDSLGVFYIYSISPSKVLILHLYSISNLMAFWIKQFKQVKCSQKR
jgi:hypothetical protein